MRTSGSIETACFVSDVNQGNKDFGFKKVGSIFYCVAPGMERLSQNLSRAVKKENVLWKCDVGVCRFCSRRLI